jgi:hypothetical protein
MVKTEITVILFGGADDADDVATILWAVSKTLYEMVDDEDLHLV